MAIDPLSRLVLGTVQLGMPYGIANRVGRPDRVATANILCGAYDAGIRILDTAQAYGESESVIGDFLKWTPRAKFEVVSKLHPNMAQADAKAIGDAVARSHVLLGDELKTILLHDPSMLDRWNDGLSGALRDCVNSGIIRSVGVSVYTPQQFERALDLDDIAAIQAPFNVFDTSLLREQLFAKAYERGKTVYVRSVFLQGLLLLSESEVATKARFAASAMQAWRNLCADLQLDPHHLALRFAMDCLPDARIVIGCETLDQLSKNVAVARSPNLHSDIIDRIWNLPPADERVIRPNLWP